MTPKRLRRYEFTSELLVQMWAQDFKPDYRITKGLPGDAKIVHVEHWPHRGAVCFWVEHESFDECPCPGAPPLDTLTFQTET